MKISPGQFPLEINSLRKVYGAKVALSGVDLRVDEGAFLGMLGVNGAGKSTLINIITGLTSPSSGTVRVFGHDVVADYRTARRLVGVANQELYFDRYFSVQDILIYQAGYFGIRRSEARKRADELLAKFGLWDRRHDLVGQLSGGMKRCLQIAKAMMHRPPVLMLDEPTAGVDVEIRQLLWEYWQDLNASGTTIVLTTHYLEEAKRLCDRFAVLKDGRIATIGSAQEMLHAVGGDLSRYFIPVQMRFGAS